MLRATIHVIIVVTLINILITGVFAGHWMYVLDLTISEIMTLILFIVYYKAIKKPDDIDNDF